MEDFNENMINWINNDNEIKKYNDKIKSFKEKRSIFETEILLHIENNNLQDNIFNLPSYSSKIQYNKNKSYETMTNKYLIDKFTKYFNDEDKALHLFNFLKEERSLTSKCCLKRD